jgi:hypothetical protein
MKRSAKIVLSPKQGIRHRSGGFAINMAERAPRRLLGSVIVDERLWEPGPPGNNAARSDHCLSTAKGATDCIAPAC